MSFSRLLHSLHDILLETPDSFPKQFFDELVLENKSLVKSSWPGSWSISTSSYKRPDPSPGWVRSWKWQVVLCDCKSLYSDRLVLFFVWLRTARTTLSLGGKTLQLRFSQWTSGDWKVDLLLLRFFLSNFWLTQLVTETENGKHPDGTP